MKGEKDAKGCVGYKGNFELGFRVTLNVPVFISYRLVDPRGMCDPYGCNFFHFHAFFREILPNIRLTRHTLGLNPPPLSMSEKCWISHCYIFHHKNTLLLYKLTILMIYL